MGKLVNEFSKQLQKKIQENDAFKEEWEIEIFEENGVVTIEGSVPSQEILEKTEAYIQNRKGVEAVINELDIDPDLKQGQKEIDIDKEDYVPPVRHHTG